MIGERGAFVSALGIKNHLKCVDVVDGIGLVEVEHIERVATSFDRDATSVPTEPITTKPMRYRTHVGDGDDQCDSTEPVLAHRESVTSNLNHSFRYENLWKAMGRTTGRSLGTQSFILESSS